MSRRKRKRNFFETDSQAWLRELWLVTLEWIEFGCVHKTTRWMIESDRAFCVPAVRQLVTETGLIVCQYTVRRKQYERLSQQQLSFLIITGMVCRRRLLFCLHPRNKWRDIQRLSSDTRIWTELTSRCVDECRASRSLIDLHNDKRPPALRTAVSGRARRPTSGLALARMESREIWRRARREWTSAREGGRDEMGDIEWHRVWRNWEVSLYLPNPGVVRRLSMVLIKLSLFSEMASEQQA